MWNLKTVFCLLDMRAFSWLVAGVTPFSLRPVIGHLGTEGRFFKYCKNNVLGYILQLIISAK